MYHACRYRGRTASELMHAQLVNSSTNFNDYLELTKPKVVALIVFTMIAAMALATAQTGIVLAPWQLLGAILGVGFAASGAAAVNCLVERHLDARMLRTQRRATAAGRVAPLPALLFAVILLSLGLTSLQLATNTLTTVLTLATFVGYAIIYTLVLKPATPQNIVIGGASGAMPPVLGWVAVTGQLEFQPLLLFLIIFVWTPPHFWALALYKLNDYRKAEIPMLPVTHGKALTRLHILLYSIALAATTMLPVAAGMVGVIYATITLAANGYFLWLAILLWHHKTDTLARKLFKYSCVYLLIIFTALLVDTLGMPLL